MKGPELVSFVIQIIQSVGRISGTQLTDEPLTKFRRERVHELAGPAGSSRRKQS